MTDPSSTDAGLVILAARVRDDLPKVLPKVPKPVAPGTAASIVGDLSRWHVHVPGPDDVVGATALHRRHPIGYWDAMIM